MSTRHVLVICIFATLVACTDNPAEPPPNNGGNDPPTSVALRPDRDNTLFEDAAGQLSNGAGQFIFAGVTNQPRIRRALLHFDVSGSAIPAGSTVDRVTLTLHMSRTAGGATTVSLHRLTRSWGEAGSDATGAEGTGTTAVAGDATWIHAFADTTSWASPGGDFVSGATASTTVQGTGFYTWSTSSSMVSDVQSWLDNPAANFGWIVIGDEGGPLTAKRFDSRENAIAENRPTLTVFYTRP